MAVTYSEMIELGTRAPHFDLPAANSDVDDRGEAKRSIDDYEDARVLVVVFTCNHCPYARHVEDGVLRMAKEFAAAAVQFVAINSNDPGQYPEDSFESMAERADVRAFPYPYLFDETQAVARDYGAVCTPDFFVFGEDRKLAYRGRFDSTRPGSGTANGEDLRAALEQLLENGEVTSPQIPSMGCNIKWKPENRPH